MHFISVPSSLARVAPLEMPAIRLPSVSQSNGRCISVTQRNHASLHILAARLAHIRSKPYLPVGDTTLACLTDGLASPSGTSTLPHRPTSRHELAMVWCLTILCVSADRRHNECVGQDQTQSVCVGIEPFAGE